MCRVNTFFHVHEHWEMFSKGVEIFLELRFSHERSYS